MNAQENGAIRAVVWTEILPWLRIARAFRLSIAFRCLFFGAIGALLMSLGWAAIGAVFTGEPSTTETGQTPDAAVDRTTPGLAGPSAKPDAVGWLEPYRKHPWDTLTKIVPDRPTILPADGGPRIEPLAESTLRSDNPVVRTWTDLTLPARRGLARTAFSFSGAVAILLAGIWAAAVWAFFGAAICRTAAVRLAADEQVGTAAALRFAWRKWPSYFAAPLLPVGGVLVIGLGILVLGWIMRLDVFLFLGAFSWPFVLAGGFAMAILLLGILFGWPLMWGTISAEGSDSFDALSRSYAYTLQRPLHYLFYAAVAGFLGWLGWLLVREFASGVIWLGYWAAGWGAGSNRILSILPEPSVAPPTGIAWFGARVIHFFAGCVKLLAVGYVFSYFWTASAAVYFLLRRDVDATDPDEVFLDADATEPSPELPAIVKDQAGAPVVADDAAKQAGDAPQDGEVKPAE